MAGHKFCTLCGEAKPHSAFNRDSSKPDGLYNYCGPCLYASKKKLSRDEVKSLRAKAKLKHEKHILDFGAMPCQSCGELKPLGDFNKNSRGFLGLYSYCRECQRDSASSRNREIRSLNLQMDADSGSKSWRHRNPKRCPRCGETKAGSEFHANDYQTGGLAGWCIRCSNAKSAKYYRDRPEKRAEINARRRAATSNPVDYGWVLVDAMCECGICGLLIDHSEIHYDHIIPLSKGGQHVESNIQPTHPICNLRKGDSIPPLIRQRNPFPFLPPFEGTWP